ncbi:helix-turn-helix domain-containing protein [Rhizobium sp. SSA_523]|uniref:helix-turn-helix domain-containing protein n=1 Tax=Rhizobium sp. SSA_523 TaxID=2952477 RepID=UPI002091CC4F|nr:helix-turn-helix domain-containing protein [Rhizobium sp. SSA_523]MCO5731682.1 helix-turn-helix domain-containing protein [Rhizobium sp. SSA_523]WKC22941.1 helix-turn-helix domain-containing protein [Rhizobium sp. SSA_523]
MLSTGSNAHSAYAAMASMKPPLATLDELFAAVPRESLDIGEGLFWQGDRAQHVFEIAEGVLRIFKIISDGRRVITGFLHAGDMVGLSLKDVYLYSAEAVTPVTVRRVTRRVFQEAIETSPDLRPQLFALICDEMAAAQDQMVLLSRKSAEERVCSFLLLIARRLNGDQALSRRIELAMSRQDMADYLGLTIETVSRTITKLVSRGVIAPNGRHAFDIAKPGKLLALCGDGDSYDSADAGTSKTRQAVWPH